MDQTANIKRATRALERGGIVAFPTDTVYGVGADALNETAVAKIFAAKGRNFDKPLIVFVQNLDEAEDFAEITPLAKKLAGSFLPGPLSLVVRKKPGVLAKNVTGKFATIGLRIPNHEIPLKLLAACKFPLAVTSANRSGKKAPKTAAEIDIKADFVLAGGPPPAGIESTVVDATGNEPKILRPGALSKTEIERVLGL